MRNIDFDHSPEKTFEFNPDALSTTDPAASSPLLSWAKTAAAGGGNFNSLSPKEILTRSGAAKSKAECYTAFPIYMPSDVSSISGSANQSRAKNQRINELRTCLNQWNDYTPDLVRNQIRRQHDERVNGDLRADFKVNNNLTVYAKYNRSERTVEDDILNLALGDASFNATGSFVDSSNNPPPASQRSIRTPAAGFFFYDTPTNGGSSSTYRGMTNGQVSNIVPSSVKVDANHHLTEFMINNANVNTDQIATTIETKTRTMQAGGTWRSGGFKADFLAGRTQGEFYRYGWRTSLSSNYGPVTMAVAPNGLWTYDFPQNTAYDQSNPANYGQLTPGAAGMPSRGPGVNGTPLTLDNPRMNESKENLFKLDMSYKVGRFLPILNTLKFGVNRRDQGTSSWGGGGMTVSSNPLVGLPEVSARSFFQSCQDTPASLGTVNGCKYGIFPAATAVSNPIRDGRDVSIVMTPADYSNIVQQVLTKQTNQFFAGAKDRPSTMLDGWTEIDVRKVWALTGVPYMNPLDCIKSCVANDGKVYDQPVTQVSERVTAGYLSTDFDFDSLPFTSRTLPFGMELNGNFGWRYVKTNVSGTSSTRFQATTLNPGGVGTTTTSLQRNSTVARDTTDIMPVFNLALWPIADKVVLRYNRAKTIARPSSDRLTGSSVVCTNDQSQPLDPLDNEDDGFNGSCSGTLGNPALRAQTNINQNLSLEWYVNKDTMLGVAGFKHKGIIGASQRVGITNARPFAGTGEVDPTGQPLDDLEFSYTTWMNGPATLKNGVELSAKTAFTYLPSVLRHTGLSANYTRVRAINLEGQIRDQITAVPLDPVGQQKYSWNTSLWYDDGALSMRLALQVMTQSFTRIADDDSLFNFYAPGVVSGGGTIPYNPGSPVFRDSRRFLDAKVAYKFKNGIELFAEARNLGRSTVTNSSGGFAPFADGVPSINDYSYGGARYMIGLVIRN